MKKNYDEIHVLKKKASCWVTGSSVSINGERNVPVNEKSRN